MKIERILIPHHLDGDVNEVFKGFTQDLFEALAPRFPQAKLLRYDGNRIGDLVQIKVGLWPIYTEWLSEITAYHTSESECYFVDEGRKLPFPLGYWKHKHHLKQIAPGKVEILEDISFSAIWPMLNPLMRPLLKAQFEARGPIYRKYFNNK